MISEFIYRFTNVLAACVFCILGSIAVKAEVVPMVNGLGEVALPAVGLFTFVVGMTVVWTLCERK